MCWVTFLKEKLEAFGKFKIFKALVENEIDKRIKCLRLDQGGEFTSREFNTFGEVNRIKRQLSTPQTPQQNGVVERKNKTILDATRTMLMEANLPHMYQREAVNILVYTFNRVHIKSETGKTPFELWFGHVPTLKYCRIFGSKCYIKRDEYVGKFDPSSDEGIFLGYSSKSKAYRCHNKRLQKIIESTNVKIDEHFRGDSRSTEPTIEIIINEPTYIPPVQNEDPITPVSSENSTMTEE